MKDNRKQGLMRSPTELEISRAIIDIQRVVGRRPHRIRGRILAFMRLNADEPLITKDIVRYLHSEEISVFDKAVDDICKDLIETGFIAKGIL
jgi:hypothetical protein